ncbi:MAG: hypothetical protein GTO02_17955, partial [Candidatus Dadabacteria bacterium]|nr:hypothetical protein [Candidatus Dadabacteria bacterium]
MSETGIENAQELLDSAKRKTFIGSIIQNLGFGGMIASVLTTGITWLMKVEFDAMTAQMANTLGLSGMIGIVV